MRTAALLLLATALALFLPCYGPALNHHLAPREVEHQHAYLVCVPPKHIPPEEVSLQAGARAHADPPIASPSPAGLPSSGKVCLASHDTLVQGMAQLAVSAAPVALGFPDLEDRHSTFIAPGDGASLKDVFLASARKPPRL